ncbi:MAG: hypothetical protein QM759_18030 [Terricaulis sp.]
MAGNGRDRERFSCEKLARSTLARQHFAQAKNAISSPPPNSALALAGNERRREPFLAEGPRAQRFHARLRGPEERGIFTTTKSHAQQGNRRNLIFAVHLSTRGTCSIHLSYRCNSRPKKRLAADGIRTRTPSLTAKYQISSPPAWQFACRGTGENGISSTRRKALLLEPASRRQSHRRLHGTSHELAGMSPHLWSEVSALFTTDKLENSKLSFVSAG